MNYKAVESEAIIPGGPRWFITFTEGPHVGLRHSLLAYDTEEKAKRRIRDLKRKELTAGVHGNLVTPAVFKQDDMTDQAPFDVMATIDPDFAESFERAIPRQVGCYPAISKHAYSR